MMGGNSWSPKPSLPANVSCCPDSSGTRCLPSLIELWTPSCLALASLLLPPFLKPHVSFELLPKCCGDNRMTLCSPAFGPQPRVKVGRCNVTEGPGEQGVRRAGSHSLRATGKLCALGHSGYLLGLSKSSGRQRGAGLHSEKPLEFTERHMAGLGGATSSLTLLSPPPTAATVPSLRGLQPVSLGCG